MQLYLLSERGGMIQCDSKYFVSLACFFYAYNIWKQFILVRIIRAVYDNSRPGDYYSMEKADLQMRS